LKMSQLNFPEYTFKIKEDKEQAYIWDPIRKKYLVLTPEEWVRQHMVAYLQESKHFPSGLINLEGGFTHRKHAYRTDIRVYNKQAEALMIIECKAPQVHIKEEVFKQVINYNLEFNSPYIGVTNGLKHYCLQFKDNKYQFLDDFPDYRGL